MKRLFYLFSVVAMAMAMALGSSCSKDDASGGGTPDNSFATISVFDNDRYYQEATIGVVRSEGDSQEVTNSIKFTVSVDVKDDTDTRNYIIATVSEDLVKNSGLGTMAYVKEYLSYIEMYVSFGTESILEYLTDVGVVAIGDGVSGNLYSTYPILPYQKQYVVCIPIEADYTFTYSEAAISSAIQVARYMDVAEVQTSTTDLDCTILTDNIGSYSCDVAFENLNLSTNYIYSHMKSSLYETLSAAEIYVRTMEENMLSINSEGDNLYDIFFKYYTDLVYPTLLTETTTAGETLDFDADNTQYTIFIYSYDDDGMTSAFKTATVTTTDYDMPTGNLGGFGDVTIDDDYSFSVDIDADTFTGIYIVEYISSYELYEYAEAFGYGEDILGFMGYMLSVELSYEQSFPDDIVDNELYFKGNYEDYTGGDSGLSLAPESDYYIFAVGIDYKGNVITDIIYKEFTATGLDNDFEITIASIDDPAGTDLGHWSYTVTNQYVKYSCGAVKTSELQGTTDAEKAAWILSEGDTRYIDIETGDIYGDYIDCDMYGEDLSAGTEYTVFVYVTTESGECVYYNSTTATTVSFEITITADNTSSASGVGTISYTPTDKNVTYYYGKIESSELSGKEDADIDELITSATYVNTTTGDYADYGSTTIQSNTALTAGTEYTIFALVIDGDSGDRLYYNSITKSTITLGP